MIKLIKKYLHWRRVRRQAKVFSVFVSSNLWEMFTPNNDRYCNIFWIYFEPNNQWYIEEALHEDTSGLLLTATEEFLGRYNHERLA